MALCPTTSGPYRCLHELDKDGKHEGACEAQAKEYAVRSLFVARNGFWYDLCVTCKVVTRFEHVEGKATCTTCKKAETKK